MSVEERDDLGVTQTYPLESEVASDTGGFDVGFSAVRPSDVVESARQAFVDPRKRPPSLSVDFRCHCVSLPETPNGSDPGMAGSAYGDDGAQYRGGWVVMALPIGSPVHLVATECFDVYPLPCDDSRPVSFGGCELGWRRPGSGWPAKAERQGALTQLLG